MLDHIRRYPALTLSALSAVLTLVVRLVPGLDLGAAEDVLAAVLSLIVGAEIHRRVVPVPTDARGLRPVDVRWDYASESTSDTDDTA
ncbi:hypothetical protein JOD54_000821 [Actinokineospora baliensis]|uniref:hypothetical protein n=1 Tax=Actinokineospora baliensis TaxID=547056 RepID=UPI00195E3C40|nr:hypothetical protein [Actinokineospora baliensis]MBM7770617.1 hypothetical protein [Actinokineospora baliensis]